LVAEVVPAAALARAAGTLARRLSRLPRERVAMAKLAVWDGLDLPLGEGLAMERRLARRLENLRREKRTPAATSAPERARRPGGNGVP
jgi:enoyl-CoA hydratase/carnithine racemase